MAHLVIVDFDTNDLESSATFHSHKKSLARARLRLNLDATFASAQGLTSALGPLLDSNDCCFVFCRWFDILDLPHLTEEQHGEQEG